MQFDKIWGFLRKISSNHKARKTENFLNQVLNILFIVSVIHFLLHFNKKGEFLKFLDHSLAHESLSSYRRNLISNSRTLRKEAQLSDSYDSARIPHVSIYSFIVTRMEVHPAKRNGKRPFLYARMSGKSCSSSDYF